MIDYGCNALYWCLGEVAVGSYLETKAMVLQMDKASPSASYLVYLERCIYFLTSFSMRTIV